MIQEIFHHVANSYYTTLYYQIFKSENTEHTNLPYNLKSSKVRNNTEY